MKDIFDDFDDLRNEFKEILSRLEHTFLTLIDKIEKIQDDIKKGYTRPE